MSKKKLVVSILLPLILILAACSSQQPAASSSTDSSSSANTAASTSTAPAESTSTNPAPTADANSQQGQNPGQPGQAMDLSKLSVEQKLAMGSLKLEGSANAITADQAKVLLPLWKEFQTLAANKDTTTDAWKALYTKIKAAMTDAQVQAITDLNLSQTDLEALMKQYDIQTPQKGDGQGGPGGGNGGGPAGTPSADGKGGPGGPAGTPPADDNGGPVGTPGAGQPGQGQDQGAGMNRMFVEALIKLLGTRAG